MAILNYDSYAGKVARHLCALHGVDDHRQTFGKLLLTGEHEEIAAEIVAQTVDLSDDDREEIVSGLIWACADMPEDTVECMIPTAGEGFQ